MELFPCASGPQRPLPDYTCSNCLTSGLTEPPFSSKITFLIFPLLLLNMVRTKTEKPNRPPSPVIPIFSLHLQKMSLSAGTQEVWPVLQTQTAVSLLAVAGNHSPAPLLHLQWLEQWEPQSVITCQDGDDVSSEWLLSLTPQESVLKPPCLKF